AASPGFSGADATVSIDKAASRAEDDPMNPTDDTAALRAEVAALRRRSHLLLALTGAALALAIWAVARPGKFPLSTEPPEMQAQTFRLIDPDGRLRGLWHCPPAGPTFLLMDEDGRVALELRQEPGRGGGVTVKDAGGKTVFRQPEQR